MSGPPANHPQDVRGRAGRGLPPGLLLLLALLLPLPACGGPDGPDCTGANLLLISIDTLRADRLGCYGNARGLTPRLDALAAEGLRFSSVYANSPKTASSHMSLFTSLLPTAHGVTNMSARLGVPARMLAPNRLTLGQVLKRAGYWNATVASGANLHARLGFQKGFGRRFSSRLRDVTSVVDEALTVLAAASEQQRPFFAFVHTYQVHGPYVPPAEYRQRFAPHRPGLVGDYVQRLATLPFEAQWAAMHELWKRKNELGPEDAAYLSDLYDAEVAYTDAVLGRLLDGLRDKGLLDDTIVVVLSDHGEEFGEHGDFEHDQLYAEHLHVPLLLRLPGAARAGTVVEGMASLIDVMPTLLELLGLDGPPGQMAGVSLVPALRAGHTGEAAILAERVMFADDYQAALRSSSSSLLYHARDGRLEAYDLAADPAERQDLAWTAPWFGPAARRLQQEVGDVWALRGRLDREATGTQSSLTPEEADELARLGYVGREASGPVQGPLERWPEDRLRQLQAAVPEPGGR